MYSKVLVAHQPRSLVMIVWPAMSDLQEQVCTIEHSINLLARKILPNSIEATDCSTSLIG
jgi:hypothetical protein